MLTLLEARACIAATAQPLAPVRLPLHAARGRLLREEVRAPHDLPAFDRSAMDGYAIRLGDSAERFRVIGEVQPGPPSALVLEPGECVRIFTGAPLPEGAGQVIMQEEVRREGDWVIATPCPEPLHVRRRGEDVRAGEVILPAGRRLGAAELSLLAHLGVVQPLVSPAPRVRHVATGRELVDPTETPALGQIRDSNSTLLAALLETTGARLMRQTRTGDDLAELVANLKATRRESWDLLLISGGASVGDYDFGPAALRKLGFEVHFHKVALRPGKPLLFASRGRQLAFVIPGNPVSHFVLFYVAILAALAALEGAPAPWPVLPLRLAAPLAAGPDPREIFWPARVELGSAQPVHPLRWQSSGDLSGLLGANALVQIPAGTPPLPVGAEVACLLLPCL